MWSNKITSFAAVYTMSEQFPLIEMKQICPFFSVEVREKKKKKKNYPADFNYNVLTTKQT